MKNFSKKVKNAAVAFTCALTLLPTANVFACSDMGGNHVLQNWHVGQIVSDCTGRKMQITRIAEDGSFSAKEAGNEISTYATHEHHYVQYSEATYKGNKASIKPAICYYKVYETIYQCTICKQKTSIETAVAQSHNYQSNKCTRCGRTKN